MLVDFEARGTGLSYLLSRFSPTPIAQVYELSAQLKAKRGFCSDMLVVSGCPDRREATIAQFVVYFVPAVFQSISENNRVIPPGPVT